MGLNRFLISNHNLIYQASAYNPQPKIQSQPADEIT